MIAIGTTILVIVSNSESPIAIIARKNQSRILRDAEIAAAREATTRKNRATIQDQATAVIETIPTSGEIMDEVNRITVRRTVIRTRRPQAKSSKENRMKRAGSRERSRPQVNDLKTPGKRQEAQAQ